MSIGSPASLSVDVATRYRARKVGASGFASSSISTTAVQIIAPGSNVNGAVVRTGSLAHATGITGLYAGASAPSSNFDGTKIPIVTAGSIYVSLAEEYYLPPGIGLWAIANTTNGIALVSYDLL